MKTRLYLLALAALILSAQGQRAGADPMSWRWGLGTYADSQITGNSVVCGVKPEASDGYDALDQTLGSRGVSAATYHSAEQDGWTGSPGFYWSDVAASIPLTPGLSKTWRVYLWADPVLSPDTSTIGLNWSYTAWTGPDWFTVPTEFLYTLTLKSKPAGITGGPDVGTTWNLSAQPIGGVYVPIYRTDNGLNGYVFDFTATAVPEPSSMMALGMGALPLAGVLVRRRRRPLISD